LGWSLLGRLRKRLQSHWRWYQHRHRRHSNVAPEARVLTCCESCLHNIGREVVGTYRYKQAISASGQVEGREQFGLRWMRLAAGNGCILSALTENCLQLNQVGL
jgi:hypothetical protein